MPELPFLIRKERRSSKSPTVPPRQMRKVFPLAAFSLVVWPRMTPSWADQSLVSPSQPLRSLPLKIGFISAGSGGASCETFSAARAKDARANVKSTAAKTRIGPPVFVKPTLFTLVYPRFDRVLLLANFDADVL